MAFNPYSAFPHRTVYTPDLQQNMPRAINAPDWSAPGATPQRLDNLAGARAHVAQRALSLARGSGVEQGVQTLYSRPSLFEGLVQPVNRMANQMAGAAQLRMMNGQKRAQNESYRANQGVASTPAADDIAGRAGQVLESDDSPLSVPGAHAASTAYEGFNSVPTPAMLRAKDFNDAAELTDSPVRRTTYTQQAQPFIPGESGDDWRSGQTWSPGGGFTPINKTTRR